MPITPSCRTVWVIFTVVALCGLDTLTTHAIQPQSCPNVLNVEAEGVLQVAILGTEHFDVTSVDPAAVRLGGVAPLRFALEDVATALAPSTGKLDIWDCPAMGADGFMDLTLEFDIDSQEVVVQALEAAVGSSEATAWWVLRLEGALFDGTPISEEVVVLVEEGSQITQATLRTHLPGSVIGEPFPVPPSCGPGETSIGSTCIPKLTSCGPGETSVGSTCIPKLSTGGGGGGGGGGCALRPGAGVDPALASLLALMLVSLGWKRARRGCRTPAQPARGTTGRETALR